MVVEDVLNIHEVATQQQFAVLVGISQQAVSELVQRGILARGAVLQEWLLSYCGNLREQAAGRASDGELDLVQERARLAKEQADKVAMSNAQMRRELAPVVMLEAVLARTARQIAAVLEAIPTQIKRRLHLSAAAIDVINGEIAKARNAAASVELKFDDDGSIGDTESDSERAEAAISSGADAAV